VDPVRGPRTVEAAASQRWSGQDRRPRRGPPGQAATPGWVHRGVGDLLGSRSRSRSGACTWGRPWWS